MLKKRISTHIKMHRYFILIAIFILFAIILVFPKESFANPAPPVQDFDDTTLRESVIPNAPAPAGVNQTGRLLYSNADVQADITDIKNKLRNLDTAVPVYVRQGVEEQLKVLMHPCPSA